MTTLAQSRKGSGLLLLGIILLGAIILWLAPEEKTLGSGIKSVYVHVAFTWSGMAGLVVAGLLGLGAAVFARRDLQSWAMTIAWVALAMFTAGFLMSAVAADLNWGAMFWQEPRSGSALRVLALALIVQVLNGWSLPYRLKGMLHFLVAVFLAWSMMSTPLVLHPGNAAQTTASPAIRFTFLSLFLLFCAAAVWIALFIQNRKPANGLVT